MATYELEEFFDAIANERQRQLDQHGYNAAHDALHTDGDWLAIIDHYMTRVSRAVSHKRWIELEGVEPAEHLMAEDRLRGAVVKLAALACAWHQAMGRHKNKECTYDVDQ